MVSQCQAAVVYALNNSSSALNCTMVVAQVEGTQQVAGSLVDTYSGSLAVTRTGNTLTFSGGSTVDGDYKTGYTPAVGFGDEGMEQNYGAKFTGLSFTTDTIYADVRDLRFDITSGTATVGSAANGMVFTISPIITGVRPAVNFTIPTAFGGGYGSQGIYGMTATNASAGAVTIDTVGTTETLTIPVDVTYTLSLGGIPGSMRLTGNLVGTRTVPEPSTIILLACGLASLLAYAWRKRT